MKYDEIKDLLQFSKEESKVFMPNEIFIELNPAIDSNPHVHFAYSYIYLTHWLYRHAKHMTKNGIINNDMIKEILGYNAKQKKLDYLIKKDGLLDQLGYTETVKDLPISWKFEDETVEFEMLSDNKEILEFWDLPRKYSIKYPVKAFNRQISDEIEDGTFYYVWNTHCIPFEVFMYCMSNDQIGTTGFYLYSYIKMMNDKFPSGWDIAIEKMTKVTGIPTKTLTRYIDVLRKYKMVEVTYNQEHFSLAMRIEDRKANTYAINKFSSFTNNPVAIEKMKVVTSKEHKQIITDEFEALFGNHADIPIDQLPY